MATDVPQESYLVVLTVRDPRRILETKRVFDEG